MIIDSIFTLFLKLLDFLPDFALNFIDGFLNLLSYFSWVNYIIDVPLALVVMANLISFRIGASIVKWVLGFVHS